MRRIYYLLISPIILLIIIPVFAQETLTINTDKSSYYATEQVHLFGDAIDRYPLGIEIIDPNGNKWLVDEIEVNNSRYEYITEPLPNIIGKWNIQVNQTNEVFNRTTFEIIPLKAEIKFDKDRYVIGDTATITLSYEGPNNEDIMDTKYIIVWSSIDRIKISLKETDVASGIFMSRILLTDIADDKNELNVKYGDVITALYNDNYLKIDTDTMINTPPVIGYDVIEDDPIIIDASKSYDPDDDKLTFRWELVEGNIAYNDNGIWIEFEPNNVVFRIIVNDGYESVSRDISIKIGEQIFPIMTARIDAASKVYEDFNIPFDAQVYGGNEPYSYTWEIEDDVINNKSFVRAFDAGIYDITLIVKDSAGNIVRDSITIDVVKPIINIIGDRNEGSELIFRVESVIEDAKYRWNFGERSEEGIESVHIYDNDGVYKLVLSIEHLEDVKDYEEEIVIENVEPDVSLIIDKNNIVEGDRVRFDITVNDPGNDNLTITLYSNNQPIFDDNIESGSLTYEHTYSTQGNYEHYVVVNDGKDIVESKRVNVIVNMSLILPIIGLITAVGAGSSTILYKIKSSKHKARSPNMRVEYYSGLDKTIRFSVDMEGGIEE